MDSVSSYVLLNYVKKIWKTLKMTGLFTVSCCGNNLIQAACCSFRTDVETHALCENLCSKHTMQGCAYVSLLAVQLTKESCSLAIGVDNCMR